MTKADKEVIEDNFDEQQKAEQTARRKAWRNLLIPAVGFRTLSSPAPCWVSSEPTSSTAGPTDLFTFPITCSWAFRS